MTLQQRTSTPLPSPAPHSPSRFLSSLLGIVLLAALACGDDTPGVDAAPADEADASAADAAVEPANDAGAADAAEAAPAYSAVAIIGGLDRIAVVKADSAADLCVVLRLVHPALQGELPIATPEGWSVEYAQVYQGAASCDGTVFPKGAVAAESGSGSVTFTTASPDAYPSTLTLDVTLEFSAAAAWVPAAAAMQAMDVPLSL